MVIWLRDFNYNIALSYSKTRKLLENNDWDALLNKHQLNIYFALTYKYFYNSDTYFREIKTSKQNRRTPTWCDRILWHINEINIRQ